MNRHMAAGIIVGVLIALLYRGYITSNRSLRLIDIFEPIREVG